MPFSRPDLLSIVNRTRDDVLSRLPAGEPLRRADAEVYARALAGSAHELYGYLDWLSRQLIYDTADSDLLERWAGIWGITRKAASFAGGTVTFSGSSGATIPTGSQLSAYDGQLYATTADAVIVGGSVASTVTAVAVGVAGNRLAGQTITLTHPLAGISASAVAGAMTGGAEIEGDDSLRSRLLSRIKQPPQGGDKTDYVAWALAVPGVTRAWCYPLELGAGTVVVRFMMDGTYADGIPLSGDVTAVAAYVDPLRPVTANVTVVAPIAVPKNFTITGLTPTSSRSAVTQSLADLIARKATPGGTILWSDQNEAIKTAAGVVDFALTSPSANIVSASGHITTMGTMTWL